MEILLSINTNKIVMSEDSEKVQLVKCCVVNCQKEVPKDKAIKIDENYFCGLCGVANCADAACTGAGATAICAG